MYAAEHRFFLIDPGSSTYAAIDIDNDSWLFKQTATNVRSLPYFNWKLLILQDHTVFKNSNFAESVALTVRLPATGGDIYNLLQQLQSYLLDRSAF